jgi:hypothetical protein
MNFVLPELTRDEATIFATFPDDVKWEFLANYLEGALKLINAQFKPDTQRDADQVLKGMKLVIETMIELPFKSREFLNPTKKDEDMISLDERPTQQKEAVNED